MSKKLKPMSQATQSSEASPASSVAPARDGMQDLIGNPAIQQIMAEEMSPEECGRYEVYVPEVERCLATGAAPQSVIGNTLIGIIGTRLIGPLTRGIMGSGAASRLGQAAINGTATQVGGALSTLLDQSRSRSNSE